MDILEDMYFSIAKKYTIFFPIQSVKCVLSLLSFFSGTMGFITIL